MLVFEALLLTSNYRHWSASDREPTTVLGNYETRKNKIRRNEPLRADAAKEISTNAAVVAGLSDVQRIFDQRQLTIGQWIKLNMRLTVAIIIFFISDF